MKHIHPFPARMAPEIALDKIGALLRGQTVLDPMSGSGMVLSQAVRSGVNAIGVDLDPLAELVSRVGATSVDESAVMDGLKNLLEYCHSQTENLILPWIDDDLETASFIDFWFASKQKMQLRKISSYLTTNPINLSTTVVDLLKVSVSRLIITKDPKASLARDTAHSRPHRTIIINDFDVFSALAPSVNHVLRALNSSSLSAEVSTHLGDARNITSLEDEAVDAIITSPPYLNAIDYMRGHRMSLVWFGYKLNDLRQIRGTAIGAEKALTADIGPEFIDILAEFGLNELENKNKRMLNRYFSDLKSQTVEAYRVLKKGGVGTYVIGNSTIRGAYVKNSELLKRAGKLAGFEIIGETIREIPNNRRYMPMTVSAGNSLAGRMRAEHIIDFRKAS